MNCFIWERVMLSLCCLSIITSIPEGISESIQELRGNSRKKAIDIYDHTDPKELKRAYLAAIPQLGI